jgi:CRP-like cAMP-binding protein
MAEYRSLKANEILFMQGDEPDNMYIVKTGQIAIFITDGQNNRIVSVAGVGELIGEVSLMDNKSRSAGAKALCDSSLVILPYDVLRKQLETLPEWVKVTMKTLSDKLRDTNQRIME